MMLFRLVLDAILLEARKWVAILLTHRLNFMPATMDMREGFDLRVCRLVDGSALLYVPHGSRSGMFCCEVETTLGISEARAAAKVHMYLAWVNAGAWSDWNRTSVTGRKMIAIGNELMLYDKRRLSQWMTWMITWRMERNAELDMSMRHYLNYSFTSLLNHLWDDISRKPAGFVERWVLKGPEAVDDAWDEAVAVYPKLKDKKHSRTLFEALKEDLTRV